MKRNFFSCNGEVVNYTSTVVSRANYFRKTGGCLKSEAPK